MRVSLRRSSLAILFFACIPVLGAAQDPFPGPNERISLAEYAARRAELTKGIDSGVVLAFGEVEPVYNWPTFFQAPAFQYLTGLGESDAVLVMVKRNGATTSTVFVPTRTRMEERWIGARTPVAGLQSKIGINGRAISGLDPLIDSLAKSGLRFYTVSDARASDYMSEDSLTRGSRFLARLRAAHPSLVTASLDSTVDRLRAKKSPTEIALLRKATQISARGHREAMKALAPGCRENEIQAVLDGTFRRLGGDRPGYGSIVGGGKNATILHYMEDNDVLRDGDLLLIDAATSFAHYSSDITRTMPVNGKFTPAQRDIYQLVRDAQEAFVQQIKPGVGVGVANSAGRAVIERGLTRLGLIDSVGARFDAPPGINCPPGGCPQVAMYALHGFGGHGIGLEVHDPAQYYGRDGKFGVGDVFTVEPGLYISPDDIAALPDTPRNRALRAKIAPAVEKYKWIGVRIEDDYAITPTGVENLSAGAPREISEIEALMAQPRTELPGGGRCGVRGAQ
jgi:Xaa-Pro aminopeptidase